MNGAREQAVNIRKKIRLLIGGETGNPRNYELRTQSICGIARYLLSAVLLGIY